MPLLCAKVFKPKTATQQLGSRHTTGKFSSSVSRQKPVHGHEHSMDCLFLPFHSFPTYLIDLSKFVGLHEVGLLWFVHVPIPILVHRSSKHNLKWPPWQNSWRQTPCHVAITSHDYNSAQGPRVLDRSWNQNLINHITFQAPKWYRCERQR